MSGSTQQTERLAEAMARALAGRGEAAEQRLAQQGKLPVRQRLELLLDPGSFVEDGLLANALAEDLPADGVVTGRGAVLGRPVCVAANDPTVKAGSWGARTVEKLVRLTEYALAHELPVFWLVDSAGARITDQVELFPGRRGAGRIFYNQVRLSGKVPRSAASSAPRRPGAPTSRRSATWSSWWRATPPCTWARPGWPRWWWGSRPP
jgi:acetyl-CoA carboxylase carboxyltransferase component